MGEKEIKTNRKELGIAGSLVVITQIMTSVGSSQALSDKIDKLNYDIHLLRVEREQYFVRKSDIHQLSSKIDQLSDDVVRVKEQINSLKRHIGS